MLKSKKYLKVYYTPKQIFVFSGFSLLTLVIKNQFSCNQGKYWKWCQKVKTQKVAYCVIRLRSIALNTFLIKFWCFCIIFIAYLGCKKFPQTRQVYKKWPQTKPENTKTHAKNVLCVMGLNRVFPPTNCFVVVAS